MEETLAKILAAEKTAETTVAEAKATSETTVSKLKHDLELEHEKKLQKFQAEADSEIATFSNVAVFDHVKDETISLDIKKASQKVLNIIYDS
jgi:hypothetical protein